MKADKYDEVYEIVVSMAKAKMLMNAHKGEIENVDPGTLCTLGKGEFDELNAAVGTNYVHVVEEVADVLNFAVAMAYNAIKGYRNREK